MQSLWKWFCIFVTGWAVSFFLYPAAFTFLQTVNTKMYLAVLGLGFLTMHILRYRTYSLDRSLINTFLIAGLYSVVNLLATDYNGFSDYSYGNYITSALVWLFAAFSCTSIIKWAHGRVDIRLWVYYMAAVSALQCILAMLIDSYEGVKMVVDSVFYISNDFIENSGRLYAIGVMLDPAGTRFAAILILIAYLLSYDKVVRQSQTITSWLVLAYVIIVAMGNIISRTTVTGVAFSFILFIHSSFVGMGSGKEANTKFYKAALIALGIAIPWGVYLYNTSEYFYSQFRFAFEGFFSLVEKGYWETSSNNILATMWKWPTTTEAWLIGYGEFDNFRFGTDIGYCRLILYSGIIGFSIFASMFVYQFFVFTSKYPKRWLLFFLLMSLSFVIWIKVSTDLFQFWAILYTFAAFDALEEDEEETLSQPDEIIALEV